MDISMTARNSTVRAHQISRRTRYSTLVRRDLGEVRTIAVRDLLLLATVLRIP